MTNRTDVLSRARNTWTQLLQFAIWLVAIVVLFVAEPPRLSFEASSTQFVRATEFVGAIVIGLTLVALRSQHWTTKRLWRTTAGLLVASVGCLFTYTLLVSNWTCVYDGGKPVVIGEHLMASATAYAAKIGDSSCVILLQDSAGRSDDIWPKAELSTRFAVLTGCFMATVLAFALAALFAVETYRDGLTEPEEPKL